MSDLVHAAIQATLSFDWNKAITINKTILEKNEKDINALNRLAYALTQKGKINEAKKIYKKILSLDRYNPIAQKNMEKISYLPKKGKASLSLQNKTNSLSPNLFLEEPGKTKSVMLTNIAPAKTLSHVYISDPVVLCTRRHSIEARNLNKTYLGALPDDIAFRLLRLIKGGNTYQAYVKNVTKNSLTIFIRETKRGKKFLLQPSFISLSNKDLRCKDLQEKSEE